MATAATAAEPQQPDVERAGQLRVPGGVGLVEGVAVDRARPGVGEERPQVQEHDRARPAPAAARGRAC